MATNDQGEAQTKIVPIYIVSGGVGASGEQLVNTVLAQFPNARVTVNVVGNARQREQIERVVTDAKKSNGLIVHTLVETRLREQIVNRAQAENIVAIDLMGDLLAELASITGETPLQQPGLYRQMHQTQFQRVEAIQYTLDHDDGRNPQDWQYADILLAGVSRTGKTPLSVYLSVLGWKVANYPIVPELSVPQELFAINRDRVIGLTISLDQLVMLREHRFSQMRASRSASYVDPEKIEEELRTAQKIFQRGGFTVIDVTDQPIETSANEVIKHITRKQGPPRIAA